MDTSENGANKLGKKRPINDDSSDSDDDIDEDELLQSDNEVKDGGDGGDVPLDVLMKNVQLDSISDVEDNEGDESTSEPERGVNLRDYQLELAALAIQGENTIVHAATGAGKTRVALYIVKDHLERKPDGKVAFMAEKTFLVNQHHRSLQKILPGFADKALCISDQKEKSEDLDMFIDSYQIFLMTPAIIENALAKKGLRFLSQFTLLVFDECHHTKKKSVYNRLMVQYHMLKEQGEATPQILGLTATLDAQKANSVDKAVEQGITIMANLDVTKLSTVVRNTDEYDKFRKDIRQEKTVLPDTNKNDDVYQCIARAMDKTEELVVSVREIDGVNDLNEEERQQLNNTLSKRGSKKADPSYITWTSEMSNTGTTLLGSSRDIGNALTVGAAYLKIYSEVLGVNDELTGTFALQALQRKLKGQNLGKYTAASEDSFQIEFQLANVAKGLESDIEKQNTTKPDSKGKKINTLLTKIRNYTNKETKFIVMVKTREMAEMLADLLKGKEVKCEAFTGSTSTSEVGGTTREKQEKIVDDFNSGKLNGLIATNILEEGLDIPDCDTVFHYNYIGNEISTRQTAGRIRKEKGKVFIMANTKDSVRHTVNVKRGLLMDEAVKIILGMDHGELVGKTKRIQSKLVKKEHTRKAESRQAKRPRLENSGFKMVCKACGIFQVDCSTIRSINNQHHVAIDPNIWPNISTKPFPKKAPKFSADITCEGRMFGNCQEKRNNVDRHCKHELGIVSTYKDVKLPFLSYKFLAVLDTEKSKTLKLTKWDEAPFKILAISDEDLETMQTSA